MEDEKKSEEISTVDKVLVALGVIFVIMIFVGLVFQLGGCIFSPVPAGQDQYRTVFANQLGWFLSLVGLLGYLFVKFFLVQSVDDEQEVVEEEEEKETPEEKRRFWIIASIILVLLVGGIVALCLLMV